MTLYLGMHDGLIIVDPQRPQDARTVLEDSEISAIAVDPALPDRLYCATANDGLLRSVDAGNTWAPSDIDRARMLSVAVSPADPSIVYAGTEPSHLYRSDDRGDTWREMTALQDVPSKPHWSFPPKPDTHHVRWITPHPTDPAALFVAIEAGALLTSNDGGESWRDRVDSGPIDTHVARMHPEKPERILSAAGDGFFESEDGGATWSKPETGLPYRYCYGLAIDSGDSGLVVMSVAPGASRGHGRRDRAQASIVRREGNGNWQVVSDGLPESSGTTLSIITADPAQGGTFYALNNTGLYQSIDDAISWQRLDVPWKDAYLDRRPASLAIGSV